MKMKDVDIKMANLQEEVNRLNRKNSLLEGRLGKLRVALMSIEFPREHQPTVDKFFDAVDRCIAS